MWDLAIEAIQPAAAGFILATKKVLAWRLVYITIFGRCTLLHTMGTSSCLLCLISMPELASHACIQFTDVSYRYCRRS